MKHEFELPTIEVIKVDSEDIMTTSSGEMSTFDFEDLFGDKGN